MIQIQTKEIIMVSAIGAISGHNPYADPEYLRIIQELRALGLTPTGNKNVDKARLESEKQKLAKKIEEKAETKQSETPDMSERSKFEEQKLGAMTVAELNKILHGLN